MKKRSLVSTLLGIQLLVFAGMCVFILLESISLYRKATEDVSSERTMMISGECRDISGRMNVIGQQTFEILRSAMDDYYSLWSENRGERLFDLQYLSALIQDKLDIYPDMGFVYIYRPGYFMLSRKQAEENGAAKIALAEYLEEAAEKVGSYPADGKWILCKVEEEDYCGILYHYRDQNFYVGTFVRADQLFLGISEQFEEYQGAGQIVSTDGSAYFIGVYEKGRSRNTLEVPEQKLSGGLLLSGYYPVEMFEIFRNNILALVLGIFLMALVSLVLHGLLIQKYILKPIRSLSDAVKGAETDLLHARIPQDARITEVAVLEAALSDLIHEVMAVRMELYERKIQEQNVQLRELRSQLKPHFYLNAIMTASTMIYQNRKDETREYLNQLSVYMRYMMRITTSLVALKEELSHVENYVRMQEIRFPDSIILITDCPDQFLEIKIPHLLLHTIVENVFKHAMNLTEPMMLMISCSEYSDENFRGLQIVVEDSGKGFTEEQLLRYNGQEPEDEETDHHIGLFNIKRSLRLHYGRDGLFHIENAVPKGARVELRIPEEG